MSEAQTLTVVGQCSGITEKPSGWTEFQISVPGKNYPVKLSTKDAKRIAEGRAVKDALATWTYNEVEGSINPRSGQPYKNRYLEGVELGAAVPQQSPGSNGAQVAEGPTPHHEAIHFADKERLITRQTCLKAAADLYSVSPEQYAQGDERYPPRVVIAAAEEFEEWLYRDIDVETTRAADSKHRTSPASGNVTASGLLIPRSWDDLRTLLLQYEDNGETWETFERFGASARRLLFGDEGLSPEEKEQLWQLSARAAVALREEVDAATFPPPSEADITKAWASVLDGQELQPVAKKEVPDAP